MQVGLSVREDAVSSDTLLRRLNNHSHKNQIYRVFREVGRAVRTIVLLRYMSDPQLREQRTRPRRTTGTRIGDVTGHDLRAAITMSQLRNMLRAIGCDRQEPPGNILLRLDLAHHTLYPQATETCLYGPLGQRDDGRW